MLEGLNLKDLKRRAETLLQKVEALAKTINPKIDAFDECCKRLVNESLRLKLIEEIDEIVENVLKKVVEKEEELRKFPSLYAGEEVWVVATRMRPPWGGETLFDFYATIRESSHIIAREMEEKGKRGNNNVRYTPAKEFINRVKKLKSLIRKGKLDMVIGMKAEEIIWGIMG